MDNKYIASLMKKTIIGENTYTFNMVRPIVGYYDEKEQLFIDNCGIQYFSITDKSLLYSETEYGFSSVVTYEKMKELVGVEYNISIYELKGPCLSHYKDIVYYISIDKADVYYLPININELNQLLIQYIAEQKLNPNNIDINELKNILLEKGTNGKQCIDDEEDEMDEVLVDLISDIVANKYSLEELKDMQQDILEQLDNVTSLTDTIKYQIEKFEKKEISSDEIKKDKNIIDLRTLYSKITETVIDQDKPILRLLTEIHRLEKTDSKKDGILLTGSTGVGKTLTMNLIAKYINRDFHIVDSTQITVPGYTGKNIEQVLWELYVKCDKDLERAERAIIYFDEIDKKGSEKKSDIAGQGVLSILLKFMDGSTYKACENSQQITSDTSVEINTSKMLIITGGAFSDVYDNLKQKIAGFNSSNDQGQIIEATTNDFKEKGMMTSEFMGRHPIVIHMSDLDINSMKRILVESTESPLREQIQIFAQEGVKLSYTDGYLDAVAKIAYDTKTGARGLKKIIADTTWCAYAEISFNPDQYEEVTLTEETVNNNGNYQLVKKCENLLKEKIYTCKKI